jgi:hypothetical protein
MRDYDTERASHLAAARLTIDTCKSQNRDLTPTEQTVTQSHLDAVTELDKMIKGRALVQSIKSLGTSETDTERAGTGGIFTPQAKSGILAAVKTRTAYRTEIDSKALLTSGTLLPASGTYTEGGLHPTSQFPLTILFPNQPAEGPSQRYYRTTSGTAEIVTEGAVKPDAGISFAAVDVLLSKIAGLANFSDEMVEDAGFLISTLQQELVAAVVAAQNKLVVDTFAATSGVLTATGVGTTIIDTIADAISAQEAISGTTPSAIIANPSVIATIRKSKATTSGVYNTDVLSASPSQLHGVRLVSSPAVPAANVWVACSTGVVVYLRGPVTVELGHTGTDWSTNTQTARAEQRLAVAVTRPTSLSKLVLT